MPQQILKKYFGYDSFRPLQKEAITKIIDGEDVLVVLPTGGGKSLIYQVPAIKKRGVTLVFSPLISLMKDQVDSLNEAGVSAAYINSSLTETQKKEVFMQATTGSLRLLYIAPEGFFTYKFQQFIQGLRVSLVAIDEAHCISEWGHDFRPEYRKLSVLKKLFPKTPLVALTATATKMVQSDIIKQLNARKMTPMIGSFERKNLSIYVNPKHDLTNQLVDILKKRRGESGIIYCSTRKKVDELSEVLNEMGFENLPYHAGMEGNERGQNQESFLKDKTKLIVATVAFGMGIDKSNIRYIIHANLPKSVEGYYQEIGRAGRDGLPSDCYLFHSSGDVNTQQFLINQAENEKYKEIAFQNLQEMLRFVRTVQCRHSHIINYFGEQRPDYACKKRCDVCLSEDIMENDITVDAQKILSCIYRMPYSVGVGTLAAVLTGSGSKKVLPFKNLSTFGIMRDKTQDGAKDLINVLIDQGYIKQDPGKYSVLSLGKNAKEILTGKQKVIVKIRSVQEREDVINYEVGLLDKLKEWRGVQAEKEEVAPYIIFSDKVLIDLATYLPLNLEELKNVSGIGQKKFEVHGEDLVDIVSKYSESKNLKSRIDNLVVKNEVRKVKDKKVGETHMTTFVYYKKGMGIEAIAEKRGVTTGTVAGHILKLINAGKIPKEDLNKFVTKDRAKIIKEKIEELGGKETFLSPVREALGEDYTYEEIKFVRAMM